MFPSDNTVKPPDIIDIGIERIYMAFYAIRVTETFEFYRVAGYTVSD
jgi:hypothetical protein